MAAAAAATQCRPVAGAERLWGKPETRWIMIGEMHGTAEMPATFADLVCLAAATGRPVTVALEQTADYQPAIDAFLASDGGPAARAAFLGASMWTRFKDGRSSEAMLALYDRLRLLKQAGQIRAVVAFIPAKPTVGDGPHNAAMAETLITIPAAPNALILAYMGSVHAAKSRFGQGDAAFLPAAAALPPDRTVSVYLDSNGGEAWNCMADGCAAHSMQPRDLKPGFTSADRLPWRYDWVYELGLKSTASRPAVPAS
jgi:hypothetical protein